MSGDCCIRVDVVIGWRCWAGEGLLRLVNLECGRLGGVVGGKF